MSRRLSIATIASRFPAFRVAAVVAEDLAIPAERPAALDRLIHEREAAVRQRHGATEDLVDLIGRFCGGRTTVAVADATTPDVALP